MQPRSIYLDNNATTQVDERVVDAMLPALRELYGNPASIHGFGEEAAAALEAARSSVARMIGARSPQEIVFTSGGTESINTALFAVLGNHTDGHVLTSATEHAAVVSTLERGAARGLVVERTQVDAAGRLAVERLLSRIAELGDRCRLVTLHWANNETGVRLSDEELRTITAACRAADIPVHLDAVQIPGKLELRVDALDVDLLSVSGHKFHGPKGVGALYVRSGRSWDFPALILGGPQESERRAGTPNVPGLVGFGRAAELAQKHAADERACARVRGLRDRLEQGLLAEIRGARVHGGQALRLDNTANVGFPDLDGELLLMTLAAEGLAASSGAACGAARRAPSHVLLAMGLSPAEAAGGLRFSLSRRTSEEEIGAALDLIPRVVADLRALEAV